MTTLLLTLLASGMLAGMIQFFVEFKKLPVAESLALESGSTNWLQTLLDAIKAHWQFFAYLFIGIAGASLVPLLYEITAGGLPGLVKIKTYSQCLAEASKQSIGKSPINNCFIEPWFLSVLFGYGIVAGYLTIKLIKSIGSFITGNIDRLVKTQQELLEELKKTESRVIQNQLMAQLELAPADDWMNHYDDDHAQDEIAAQFDDIGCILNPNPSPWKDWRAAKSILVLRDQLNKMAPRRSISHDGIVGDGKHETRKSDHNAWVWDQTMQKGVVTAIDITHDQQNGCDCNLLAQSLQANKDKRIKYVIWNGQIMSNYAVNGVAAWSWRPYSGENKHEKHIHISVSCKLDVCDNERQWLINV